MLTTYFITTYLVPIHQLLRALHYATTQANGTNRNIFKIFADYSEIKMFMYE